MTKTGRIEIGSTPSEDSNAPCTYVKDGTPYSTKQASEGKEDLLQRLNDEGLLDTVDSDPNGRR
jgi:hypothetical protein